MPRLWRSWSWSTKARAQTDRSRRVDRHGEVVQNEAGAFRAGFFFTPVPPLTARAFRARRSRGPPSLAVVGSPRRSLVGGAGALGGPVVRLALLVAYDGTGFRGFARQEGDVRTVQGELEAALTRVCRAPVEVVCAGRTDAGVHAFGQVVSFSVDTAPPRLAERLTKMLGPEIAVRAAVTVPEDFSARFSAERRLYEYRCYRSPAVDPFRDRYALRVDRGLQVEPMREGARALVGEHDFSSFCRQGANSLVRNVRRVAISLSGESMTFTLEADSFCHQMVRSIVGLLLDVGRGARAPEDVGMVLAARDRSAASPVAPPHGLHLMHVSYGRDLFRS